MGAEIDLDGGYINASALRGLTGAKIVFPKVSVGATENLMMAATLAKGETRLVNAACEPEVIDLAHCLNAMGADIEGAGCGEIVIRGVPLAPWRQLFDYSGPHRDRHLCDRHRRDGRQDRTGRGPPGSHRIAG